MVLVHNGFPGIVGTEWEWYPFQRSNSARRCLFEIQITPAHRSPALGLALEYIKIVTIPGVAETFKNIIDKMTHGTNSTLVNSLRVENAIHTDEDLITSIDEQENRWSIHFLLYDTLTSRVKLSSNGQLSYCACSFGMLITLISTRQRTVWAGKLQWIWTFYSNFNLLLHLDSIHSMTGVIRQCGYFQLGLTIQRIILWWKSMV